MSFEQYISINCYGLLFVATSPLALLAIWFVGDLFENYKKHTWVDRIGQVTAVLFSTFFLYAFFQDIFAEDIFNEWLLSSYDLPLRLILHCLVGVAIIAASFLALWIVYISFNIWKSLVSDFMSGLFVVNIFACGIAVLGIVFAVLFVPFFF